MLAAPSSQLSGVAFAVVVLATSTVLVAGLAWASRRPQGLPVGALRRCHRQGSARCRTAT
jgi:hypothetical protein